MNFVTKPLVRLFASMFLFATAVGMNFVTFPAILLKHGVDPFKIGLTSAFEIVGGITMSFILAKVLRKIPARQLLPIVAITYSVIVALIFFCKNYYLWLFLVLLIGMCWVAYVVMRQAWMNILLTNQNRGVATGLYSMIISIGLGFGPLLVKFLGAENYYSFIASALFIIVSLLVLERSSSLDEVKIEEGQNNFLFFFKSNPRCYLARFFFDLQNYCLLTFGVVFGKKVGLSAENSGLLITAFMASFFADFLVGLALKKYDAYKIINIGFIGYLIFICVIGLCFRSYKILLLAYFMLGIFAACIYIATIVIANGFYKKDQLVSANAALQSVGSSGSFFGGLIGGIAIQVFSAHGYMITIILSCVLYLIFLVIYEKKNPSRS
jgi:MFS family permease